MAVEQEPIAAGIVAGGLEEITVNDVTYAGSSYDTVASALSANTVVAAAGGTFTSNVAPGTKTLAVKDAVFSVGTAGYNGGAVNASGSASNFIAENVVFTGNTATNTGGAIFSAGTVTLVGSTVSDNYSAGTGGGGGIRVNGAAILNVSNSVFDNNNAAGGVGGGIVISSSTGVATVTDSVFTNNSSKNGGSAIYNYGTLTVTGGTFSDNSGYAIINNNILTIKDSYFAAGQNLVQTNSGKTTILTGTITCGGQLNGATTLSDVNLVFNNTEYVDFGGVATLTEEKGGLLSVSFNAGEVRFASSSKTFDLSDVAITIKDGYTGNVASRVVIGESQTVSYGTASVTVNQGALTADKKAVVMVGYSSYILSAALSKTITIDGVGGAFDTFASISAAESAYAGYAGSYTVTDAVTLNGTVNNEIINNSTITVDGLLTLGTGFISGGLITIDGSKFSSGDTVISNYDEAKITGEISVSGSYYTYVDGTDLKIAEAVVAGIVADGENVAVINGVTYAGTSYDTISAALSANTVVAADGGAAYVRTNITGGKTLAAKDIVFCAGSTTSANGGAVGVGTGANFIGENVVITGSTATSNAGAVYSTGNVTLVGSTVSDNVSVGNSGAIRLNAADAVLNISNSVLDNNKSLAEKGNGGAVYISSGSGIITNTVFSNNTAANGGAIYNGATLTIVGGTFTGNTAGAGTAIYNAGTTVVNGAVFGERQTIYSNNSNITLQGTISTGGSFGGSSSATYKVDGLDFVFTNAGDITIKELVEINSGLLSVTFNNSGIVNFESADLSDVAVTIDGSASGVIATGVVMGADQKIVFGGNTIALNAGFLGSNTAKVNAVTCVDSTLALSVAETITIDGVGGAFDTFASISAAESAYAGYTGSYTVTGATALNGTVNNEIINNSTITVDGLLTLGSGSIAGGSIVIDGSKFSAGDTVIANYDASKITGNISVDGSYYTYTDGSDLKVGQAVAAGIVAGGATSVVINGVHYVGTSYDTVSASMSANAVTAVVGGTPGRISTDKTTSQTIVAKDIEISGCSGAYAGGAIWLQAGDTFYGENIVLSGNTVSGRGAGIDAFGNLTLINSTISDNIAGNGSAMRFDNADATFLLQGCTISGNSCTSGGTLYITAGSGTVSNTVFSNNTAKDGGGIQNGGTVVIDGGTFTGNSVTGSGAAVYNNGTMTIKDSVFGAGQTVYSNSKPLTFAGTITIGASIGGNGFGFDNASLIFTNTETIDWRKNQYTIVNDGIVSIKFNGNEVRFGNATGATSYLDLSATAITVDCALPADDVTLTIASGITLADGQAITVNGIAVTVGTAFTVGGSNYLAAYTDNALTLSKIPAENPDITGTVTGLDTIASSTNYKGKVFGGETVTGGTVTTASAVTANAGDSNVNALFGGSNINADSTAIVTADSSVNVSGIESANFVFGGHYVAGGTVALTGNTEVTISDGTFNRFVGGGNIVNTDAVLRTTSNSTLNISGGVFNEVVAGGSNSQGGKISYIGSTITTNISGGTFNKRVFGGNIASKQAYATKNDASVSPIDITGGATVSINIDSSANEVYFGSDIVAGSYNQGQIVGTTKVTFTGLGENLDFNGVLTGDSTSAGEANKYVTGTRTLVFDDFDGDFSASGIVAFDDVKFINGSEMTFTTTDLNMAAVKNWTFELGSTLNWEMGTNSFFGDTLTIDFGGASFDSNWTIINGCETTLTYWDNGFALNGVVINGETAAWDSALGCYTSENYKLFSENNDLIVGKLA